MKYWRRSRFSFFSFILRFWNQIFTCRSVRLSILDKCRRFSLFMYTLKKNSRSSSRIWYFVYGHLFFLDFVAPTKRNVTWLHYSEFEVQLGCNTTADTSGDDIKSQFDTSDRLLMQCLNCFHNNGPIVQSTLQLQKQNNWRNEIMYT